MATIIVMGAGIGGTSQAYELQKELGRLHRVILVGDSDQFEFTPSNPWVSVGWRKVRQMIVPYYEKTVLKLLGATRLKEPTQ